MFETLPSPLDKTQCWKYSVHEPQSEIKTQTRSSTAVGQFGYCKNIIVVKKMIIIKSDRTDWKKDRNEARIQSAERNSHHRDPAAS